MSVFEGLLETFGSKYLITKLMNNSVSVHLTEQGGRYFCGVSKSMPAVYISYQNSGKILKGLKKNQLQVLWRALGYTEGKNLIST